MQLRICAIVASSCLPKTLSGLFWYCAACGLMRDIGGNGLAHRAQASPCARHRETGTTSASAAGRADRSSHRGRARPRPPEPGRAPGRDRIASHPPSLQLRRSEGRSGLRSVPCQSRHRSVWFAGREELRGRACHKWHTCGSFSALAAEGDPLPRYAGRLPWRYDSRHRRHANGARQGTTDAGRPAGLHHVTDWCLNEASSFHGSAEARDHIHQSQDL